MGRGERGARGIGRAKKPCWAATAALNCKAVCPTWTWHITSLIAKISQDPVFKGPEDGFAKSRC